MTTSLLIVSLLVLETVPVAPGMAAVPVPPVRCEIAATEHVVDLVAVPADRAASPVESASFERTVLGTFTIVPVGTGTVVATATRRYSADARRPNGGAWVRTLQQRARSPGDPDPL
jgi:hypothetical protein